MFKQYNNIPAGFILGQGEELWINKNASRGSGIQGTVQVRNTQGEVLREEQVQCSVDDRYGFVYWAAHAVLPISSKRQEHGRKELRESEARIAALLD